MTDPMAGRYCVPSKRGYEDTFRLEFWTAKERLAPLGGNVTPGVHDYEAFIYEREGLRLVFYPHKTSAGNRHIRVRTTGKFDPAVLREALFMLAENSCCFQFPADHMLHGEAVRHSLQIGRKCHDSPGEIERLKKLNREVRT